MGHTPGPWVLNGWDIVQRDCGDDFPPLAKACNGRKTLPLEVTSANARLIAAAPDLLEACELLLIYLGDWNDMEDETCVAARRAIAKARGQDVPNG